MQRLLNLSLYLHSQTTNLLLASIVFKGFMYCLDTNYSFFTITIDCQIANAIEMTARRLLDFWRYKPHMVQT